MTIYFCFGRWCCVCEVSVDIFNSSPASLFKHTKLHSNAVVPPDSSLIGPRVLGLSLLRTSDGGIKCTSLSLHPLTHCRCLQTTTSNNWFEIASHSFCSKTSNITQRRQKPAQCFMSSCLLDLAYFPDVLLLVVSMHTREQNNRRKTAEKVSHQINPMDLARYAVCYSVYIPRNQI